MNAKVNYQSAYRMLRSQYNWDLRYTRKTYEAYQLAKKMFGENMATAAFNTICQNQRNFTS